MIKKIAGKDTESILGLTPMQQGLLFHYMKDPRGESYFNQLDLEAAGEIDWQCFEKSWNLVIQNNEVLRTVFRWEKLEKPIQVVLKTHTLDLQYEDLTTVRGREEQNRRWKIIKHRDRDRQFDLRQVPFRVILGKMAPTHYHILISNHHILYDGWSTGIILKEFFQAYQILAKGGRLSASPVKSGFKEFVQWHGEQDRQAQQQFWQHYLEGIDAPTRLPFKQLKPGPGSPGEFNYRFHLPGTLKDRLEVLAKEKRLSLAAVFYSAWGLLLQKYCRQEDVVFGTIVSGRSAPIRDIENLVGLLINTIPHRSGIEPGETLLDFLERINRRQAEVGKYENTPLVDINSCWQWSGRVGEELFDTIAAVENYPVDTYFRELGPQLSVRSYSMEERPHYDLTVVIAAGEGIDINLIYNNRVLEKETVKRLAGHFRNILHGIGENVHTPVENVDMLSAEEKHQLIKDFNCTETVFPGEKSIHRLFEEQVDRTPDNIALIGKLQNTNYKQSGAVGANLSSLREGYLSYREFNAGVNGLASELIEKGVGPDVIVGIMLERSTEMVSGILAILKAGGAYLPIDPGYPRERVQYILEDSKVKILVKKSDNFSNFHPKKKNRRECREIEIVNEPSARRAIKSFSGGQGAVFQKSPLAAEGKNHLAYVIYTSGSTGKPKGVLVQHGAVVNLLWAMQRRYPLMEKDAYLLKTSYLFDVSVTELFGWYWQGGRLAVLGPGAEKDPVKIIDFIERYGVSHINFVPSMFNVFSGVLEPAMMKRLSGLKYIFLAGEAIVPGTIAQFRRLNTVIALENIYGPTEATVYASWYSLTAGIDNGPVSIGKPLPNVNIYILDHWGFLQPIGVPGELCISGAGLARGYLNKPGLTGEKFVIGESKRAVISQPSLVIDSSDKLSPNDRSQKFLPNDQCPMTNDRSQPHHSTSHHSPLTTYHTGDLARWLPDGNIEFLGRMDFQVKVRGFRIEPGEIENRLVNHPQVKKAVVTAHKDKTGEVTLCAYVVGNAAVDELRGYLAGVLPGYMVPAYFEKIKTIPLTPSAKIDRKALPVPMMKSRREYIQPGNELEKNLVKIWSEVLGIDKKKIGINDHFFELGGHSLKAATLISKIHKQLNVKLPISGLFKTPRLGDLAAYIKNSGQQSRIHGHVPIEPVEKKEYYPLSPAQKRLYILQQFTAANTSYNMPYILPLKQPADRHNPKETLEIVFKTLIARHESLRTSFETINEKPVQRIHESVDFEIKFHHHEKWQGEEVIIEHLLRPFDLSRAPLLRVELIKTGEGALSIFVDMHHIITDGTSQNILEKEFITLYRDPGKRLPGQRLQYRDYSQWVNHPRQQESREQQKNYWLRQFPPGEELPVLNLPTDNPRPLVQSIEGNWVHFALNPRETEILRTIARDNDVTLFMCLLAVFNVLFSRLSGQEDIILGVPTAARRHTDLHQVMGMLVNTLVIRNYPGGDKTFSQFLKEIKTRTLEAYENQEYPFEELVDHISVNRDTGRNPLFDILLNLLNQWEYHHENREMTGDTEPPYHHRKGTSRFDMAFSAIQLEEHVSFDLEYSTNMYKPGTIDRFIKYLKMIVQSLPGNTHQKMAKIEMLSAEEKKEILGISNGIEEIFHTKRTIHELYREQSAKTPDHIALVGHEPWSLQVTYRELNERANQLAHLLKEKGVSADSVAGIILERSVEMIVGILGILKAEAAYLPIDFDYPPERISRVLSDSGARVALTRGEIFERLPVTSLKNMTLSHDGVNLLVTPPRAQTSDFDSIPKPDRTLVNYEKYHQSIGIAMAKHTVSIQATRGCPFHCAYCHKIWSKKQVARSAGNILEEIRCCYDAGVRRIVFIDDIFNLDRKNSMQVFEQIINQNLEIQLFFPNGLRGDILSKDFIDLLMEAGTVNIDLALESASPRIQRLIGKNLNLEKFEENTRYINRKYPQVLLEMELMIGFPTETAEEALSTLEFLESLKWVHFPNLNILKIYPNTDMHRLAIQNGIDEKKIRRSANLAYHELPETLPFSKAFVREYQARFMNRYFLSQERLLQVLPHQVRTLTEDELVQKYDSYLPMEIKNFSDILRSAEIPGHRLGPIEFLPPDHMAAPGFREKVRRFFPVPPEVENPFRVLLVDLSLFFRTREQRKQMLYDMVEEPLGLMYLASYLDKKFSGRVSTRIIKSRIDFDSFDELKNIIMEFRPGLIGIRTLSYYKEFFHRAVLLIRHWGITTPIIAGGPYATSDYHLILQDPHVDVVVLGEGEITFGLLVEKIMANNNQLPGEDVLTGIQGIAFARNRHKKNSPAKQTTREILLLDEVAETLAGYPRHNPGYTGQPGNLLYIIYTSGSTGTPKGVMLEQRNLINLIQYQYRHTQIDFSSVLQFTTISFDVSAQEIFSTLLAGGRLSMVNKETLPEVPKLFKLVERNQIKTLFLPASFLKFVINEESFIQMLSNSISHIVTAGEQVVVNEVFKKYLKMKKVCFHNHYGPSETHVVTAFTMSTTARIPKLPPIGRPVANTQIYILHKQYQPVPLRVPGEIFIGGSQVGRGYLNNPELTAEKFKCPMTNDRSHPHHSTTPPFTTHPSPLYRTGDLGQWLPDGNIEFLGRMDHQVKIRGYRVELGEIESRLLNYPGVKEVVVLLRTPPDETHDKYLCAYIVSAGEISLEEMRKYLSTDLPDYMIPSHFIFLERIPLTPNGKIDRKALPSLGIREEKKDAAPRDDTEKTLQEIWSGVLGIEKEKISIHDNFFHLGGHSLKATVLVSRISKELGVKVPLTEVFINPTVQALASFVRKAEKQKFFSINPVEKKEYYHLSSAQKRLHFLQQMELGRQVYNMPAVMILQGELDRRKFEEIFKKSIERHESLRTSFEMIREETVQRIHDDVEFEIEYFDITTETGTKTGYPANIIHKFLRAFDLVAAPLIRVGLIKEENTKHYLMVDMHHIIADGTSIAILQKEIMSLYRGTGLQPLRIHYKEYAAWQTSPGNREALRTQEKFWLLQYEEEIPVLNLPTDYPRSPLQSFEGDRLYFELSGAETLSLKNLMGKQDVTLYMVLLAVCNTWFSKLSGDNDIVIGTPIAGRRHDNLQDIIGMFVNTLALRNYPVPEKTFSNFLKEVKARTLEAFQNQDYQFEDLVDLVVSNRDTSRNPVFDVMFGLQNMETPGIEIPGLVLKPCQYENKTSKFDLNLSGMEKQGKLTFDLEYSTKLFKEETARRFAAYFKNIINFILENPEARISAVEIMSKEEKKRILEISNGIAEHIDAKETVHGMFEKIVVRNEDRTALVFNDTRITYGELNQRANRQAYVLRSRGIGPDTPVGLMLERSIELVTGILGILKAGGAYLPVDTDYPGQRKKYMIMDSRVSLVLTNQGMEAITDCNRDALAVPVPGQEDNNALGVENPDRHTRGAHLVYLIYTSGTTGEPKGIMMEHRNLVNLLIYQYTRADIPFKRVLQFTTISFDVSFQEIFSTLLAGGTLYLVEKETRNDIPALFAVIKKNEIETLFLPASFLKFVMNETEYIERMPTAVRHIVAAGEQLIVNNRLRRYLEQNRVWLHNHYGPAETHVVTMLSLDPRGEIPELPSIGKPVSNTGIYILDRDANILPARIAGEIYIGGNQVGRGYLNNPELTKSRFLETKNRRYRSRRSYLPQTLYKTGDLGKWQPEGNIEFLGRIDTQVKIRGFRIELGEIESCLATHIEINEAVVVSREENHGIREYLCGYFVAGRNVPPQELREYLSKSLPDYMIPSYFVQVEKIPITPNGKIDRKALPAPEIKTDDNCEAPRDKTEKKLVEIWSEVLCIEKENIGINDNFFHLGGHSLKGTVLISRIQKELDVKLPIAELFKNPTIEKISHYIKSVAKIKYDRITRVEEKEYYDLSSAQKRLFILDKSEGEINTAYNLPGSMLIEGELDTKRIDHSFTKLIKRHGSFRTSFDIKGGKPVQIIHDDVVFEIKYFMLEEKHTGSETLYPAGENELSKFIKDFIKPFELEKAPLLRAALIRLSSRKHLLLFDMHHIISDGFSTRILVKEFLHLYEGTDLPQLKYQYKDFSVWQNKGFNQEEMKKQEDYWLNRFKVDIPVLKMKTDFPRPSIKYFEGNTIILEINKTTTNNIKQMMSETGATLFQFLLAVFNILLSRYTHTQQEDIIVGVPIAGRNHADLESIIGMFVNTLAIRIYQKKDLGFSEFLVEVKKNLLEAYENQDYPLEELVNKLVIPKDLSRNPLFDVLFVSENLDIPPLSTKDLEFTPYEFENKITHLDLVLYFVENDNKIQLRLEYSTRLFKDETARVMLEHYIEIVEQIVDNREICIKDIRLSHDFFPAQSRLLKENELEFAF